MREHIPHVVGQVFLFGKQTDRAARLEMIAYRTTLDKAKTAVGEIGGDALGPIVEEEVTSQVPAVQQVLSWNWRLPDDTPPEKRLELINQERREILLNRWPQMPQKVLGGKSATKVAGDESQRVKLLAAILLLQVATDQVTSDFDFNELRRKLGLPTQDPIDPAQVALAELPLPRLSRIDVKKLSDEELVDLYRRADHYRHVAAIRAWPTRSLSVRGSIR